MLNSKLIIWLLGIAFVILIIFLPGYSKLQELKDKKRGIDLQIAGVQRENARLEDEMLRMQEDPIYQEDIVRQKLGVVRKGEVIYKLEPEE